MRVLILIFCLQFNLTFGQTPDEKHFYASENISKVSGWCFYRISKKPFLSSLVGFATAVSIGIAKEVYDCYKPNKTGFDLKDLGIDIAGAISGSMKLAIIIDQVKKHTPPDPEIYKDINIK